MNHRPAEPLWVKLLYWASVGLLLSTGVLGLLLHRASAGRAVNQHLRTTVRNMSLACLLAGAAMGAAKRFINRWLG